MRIVRNNNFTQARKTTMKKVSSRAQQRAAIKSGLLGLALISSQVFALQPLITDDTGTQGEGGNQAEVSFNHDRSKAGGAVDRLQSLPVVYTRGVTETLDVYVGTSYASLRGDDGRGTTSGMGSPSLGAKWRFFDDEESKTSLAIKPELVFPVSERREDGGLGVGKTSANLTLILSQELPFGALHVNAGVGRDRFRNTQENPDATTRRFSLAPVWDVAEQWKLALDMGVESARAAGRTVHSKFAEIGAIYSPHKDVDLALGVIRANDNESPRTTTDSVSVGATFRF
jgi:hypothetical protein